MSGGITVEQALLELESAKRIIFALVAANGGRATVTAQQLAQMGQADTLVVSLNPAGDAYELVIGKLQDILQKEG